MATPVREFGRVSRRANRPLPAMALVTLAFAPSLLLVPGGCVGDWVLPLLAGAAWCGALGTVLRRRRDAWTDAALLLSLALLGAGVGNRKPPLHPPPNGLPELTVRGRLNGTGRGIRDLAVAWEGEWLPLSGRYLLAGDVLPARDFIARAHLVPFDEPRLPGTADRWRGARWSGASGRVRILEAWRADDAGSRSSLAAWRTDVRGHLTRRVGRSLDERIAPLIPQMVWGELFDCDAEVERWFRVTGTMHLLAISGLHVSLIALLVEFLFRVVVPRRGPRTLLVLAGLAFYQILVGSQPSVLRSTVMAAAILVAQAMGRPGSGGAGWWGSLLLGAIFTPSELTGPGAQLSFLATAALIVRPQAPRRLATVAASFCATMATGGVLFAHFGETAPSAVLVNIVGIPAFTPCLISVLWGLAWGDPASSWLQSVAWGPARLFIDAWLRSVGLFVPLGEATVIRIASGEGVGLLSSVAFLAACIAIKGRAGAWKSTGLVVIAAALSLAAAAAPAAIRSRAASPEILVLPVGQGDSILIRPSPGRAFLVDTGPEAPDGSRGRRLALALRSRGVTRLQGLFLTHGDFDHCGALGSLLAGGVEVDSLWLSQGDDYALRIARRRAPPVRALAAPRSWSVPPLRIELLWPRPEIPTEDGNEASLVLRVRGPGGTVLLAGDLGGEAEEALRRTEAVGRADVLMAGHHGSRGSTADAWIDALGPTRAIVSCGARNRFGHPHPDLLGRFARRGIPVLRTDLDGLIRVSWEGGRISVRACG